jgi:hypothetical protein
MTLHLIYCALKLHLCFATHYLHTSSLNILSTSYSSYFNLRPSDITFLSLFLELTFELNLGWSMFIFEFQGLYGNDAVILRKHEITRGQIWQVGKLGRPQPRFWWPETVTTVHDFRLLLWCQWDLCSSRMLMLEDGTDRSSWNFSN